MSGVRRQREPVLREMASLHVDGCELAHVKSSDCFKWSEYASEVCGVAVPGFASLGRPDEFPRMGGDWLETDVPVSPAGDVGVEGLAEAFRVKAGLAVSRPHECPLGESGMLRVSDGYDPWVSDFEQ